MGRHPVSQVLELVGAGHFGEFEFDEGHIWLRDLDSSLGRVGVQVHEYALHTSQAVALTGVLETRITASSSVAESLISLWRDRICI